MAILQPYPVLVGFLVLYLFVSPVYCFGAGNIAGISKIEGQNWRHGDIEDALLTILLARAAGGKKFDKLMVSRVYFGNWLRDYSQAIDLGGLKYVSAEGIRLLLCVLGFVTFGYGSREFEVTADRLGCYRPEDHIDNPKDYADNEDARNWDRRLRGPVDEGRELAIDPETGMKNYIANEGARITNSATHVRTLFKRCIELGRSYGRSKNKEELYEALRLLGTGLHCLEDFFAHSNYIELALIEMGERDIFPVVGRDTKLNIPGARGSVYPLVTGTFGGVDFLHSVTGEVSDKMVQSEIQDLEDTLQQNSRKDTSMLRELLDKIPSSLFGGDDKKAKLDDLETNAAAAQMENVAVSPRDPEEFTNYVNQIFKQVQPAIEFHDDLLQTVSSALSDIPVLGKIIEQLEEQLSMFVFQQIAPFVIPVIDQVKNELATGSTEIIEQSKDAQHNVFQDDNATDPTHSMLSKDHFTNILNEIAGRTASQVVSWVVPKLMNCWDDDSADVDRVLSSIVHGVLHHPAQRDNADRDTNEGRALIFRSIEEWWQGMPENAKDEYRQKLSRRGVENGQNHKEGEHDTGHGCGGKLSMHKNYKGGKETLEDKIAGAAVNAIMGGVKSGFSNAQSQVSSQFGGSGTSGGGGGGYGGSSGGGGGYGGSSSGGGYGGGSSGGGYGGSSSGGGSGAAGLMGGGALGAMAGSYMGSQSQSDSYGGGGGGYSQQSSSSYQREESSSYQREESHEERTESRYERQEDSYGGGGGGYGRRQEEQQEESYGGGGGYGRRQEEQEESYGGGGGGYGRRQEEPEESYGGGGGYGRRQEEEPERREEEPERREEEQGEGGEGFLDGIARQAREALEERQRQNEGGGGGSGWGF